MAEGLEKNLFYKKMRPYFDNGILREICSTDDFSVMSLGEIYYVACPFSLLADEPYGIYMNQNVLRKIMKDVSEFYATLQDIINDLANCKKIFFYFSIEDINLYKQWIKENAHAIRYDYDFEAELKELSKNCPKREDSVKSEKKQKRKWFR